MMSLSTAVPLVLSSNFAAELHRRSFSVVFPAVVSALVLPRDSSSGAQSGALPPLELRTICKRYVDFLVDTWRYRLPRWCLELEVASSVLWSYQVPRWCLEVSAPSSEHGVGGWSVFLEGKPGFAEWSCSLLPLFHFLVLTDVGHTYICGVDLGKYFVVSCLRSHLKVFVFFPHIREQEKRTQAVQLLQQFN